MPNYMIEARVVLNEPLLDEDDGNFILEKMDEYSDKVQKELEKIVENAGYDADVTVYCDEDYR